MRASRLIGRRSFIAQVIGGAAVGGSALALIAGRAQAGGQGVTDCDPTDPGGRGSGRRPRTGVTDRDSGSVADPAGCGRGGTGRPVGDTPYTGVTDRDVAPNADPPLRGRGTAGRPLDDAPRTSRCSELAERMGELGRGTEQPERWTDDQLRQAETDQNTVQLTAGYQEDLGRRVMRREISSEDANRQLMSLHEQTAAIAGRYRFAYHNDFFAFDAFLRMQIGRARAAAPQRAALNQERARIRQEFLSLNCFN